MEAADWSYVGENNGIDAELVGRIMGMEGVGVGGGKSENRKTFSHRAHGFPTAGVAKETGKITGNHHRCPHENEISLEAWSIHQSWSLELRVSNLLRSRPKTPAPQCFGTGSKTALSSGLLRTKSFWNTKRCWPGLASVARRIGRVINLLSEEGEFVSISWGKYFS